MPIRYQEKQHVTDSGILTTVTTRDGPGSSIDADNIGSIHGSNIATDIAVAMAFASSPDIKYPETDTNISIQPSDSGSFAQNGSLEITNIGSYPYPRDTIQMVEWRWDGEDDNTYGYFRAKTDCLQFAVPFAEPSKVVRVQARIHYPAYVTEWTDIYSYTTAASNDICPFIPKLRLNRVGIGDNIELLVDSNIYDPNNIDGVYIDLYDNKGNIIYQTSVTGAGNIKVPTITSSNEIPRSGRFRATVRIRHATGSKPDIVKYDTYLTLENPYVSMDETIMIPGAFDNMDIVPQHGTIHTSICSYTKDEILVCPGVEGRMEDSTAIAYTGTIYAYNRRTQKYMGRELYKWAPANTVFAKRSSGEICYTHIGNTSGFKLYDYVPFLVNGDPGIVSSTNTVANTELLYGGASLRTDNENNLYLIGTDTTNSPIQFKVVMFGADGTTSTKFTVDTSMQTGRTGCVGTIAANGDLYYLDVGNRELSMVTKADLLAGNNNHSLVSAAGYAGEDRDTSRDINHDVFAYDMCTLPDGRMVLIKPHLLDVERYGWYDTYIGLAGILYALFVYDEDTSKFEYVRTVDIDGTDQVDYNTPNDCYDKNRIRIMPLEDGSLAITGGLGSRVYYGDTTGTVALGANKSVQIVRI